MMSFIYTVMQQNVIMNTENLLIFKLDYVYPQTMLDVRSYSSIKSVI